jgi:hypothetical protein
MQRSATRAPDGSSRRSLQAEAASRCGVWNAATAPALGAQLTQHRRAPSHTPPSRARVPSRRAGRGGTRRCGSRRRRRARRCSRRAPRSARTRRRAAPRPRWHWSGPLRRMIRPGTVARRAARRRDAARRRAVRPLARSVSRSGRSRCVISLTFLQPMDLRERAASAALDTWAAPEARHPMAKRVALIQAQPAPVAYSRSLVNSSLNALAGTTPAVAVIMTASTTARATNPDSNRRSLARRRLDSSLGHQRLSSTVSGWPTPLQMAILRRIGSSSESVLRPATSRPSTIGRPAADEAAKGDTSFTGGSRLPCGQPNAAPRRGHGRSR